MNLGEGIVEEESWRRSPRGEIREEESLVGTPGGEILDKESWRRHPGGGYWRRNPAGGILEKESWRSDPGGGNPGEALGVIWETSGKRLPASGNVGLYTIML